MISLTELFAHRRQTVDRVPGVGGARDAKAEREVKALYQLKKEKRKRKKEEMFRSGRNIVREQGKGVLT